jgi:hypothetical protein
MAGLNHSPVALISVKDTGAHITGGWEGPRADLDCWGEDNVFDVQESLLRDTTMKGTSKTQLYRLIYYS